MDAQTRNNAAALEPMAHDPVTAGQLLGVSRATVDRLIASGELRAKRAGRRVLISEAAIRDFLNDD